MSSRRKLQASSQHQIWTNSINDRLINEVHCSMSIEKDSDYTSWTRLSQMIIIDEKISMEHYSCRSKNTIVISS